jgi:hypothetical protein
MLAGLAAALTSDKIVPVLERREKRSVGGTVDTSTRRTLSLAWAISLAVRPNAINRSISLVGNPVALT